MTALVIGLTFELQLHLHNVWSIVDWKAGSYQSIHSILLDLDLLPISLDLSFLLELAVLLVDEIFEVFV